MTRQVHYDFVVLAHQPRTIRQYRAYTAFVRAFARAMPFTWRDPLPRSLGGHYGVTRSLVAGLEQLGVRFAYAPDLKRTTARAAIVLAGIDTLNEAMSWRSRGGCEILLAGPNVVELPHDADRALLSDDIDCVVVASEKIRRKYLSLAPDLSGRICVWPAGVDEHYWQFIGAEPRRTVLIYSKRMPELARSLADALQQSGFRCEIVSYSDRREGRYRLHQFRSALAKACACVMLTLDEQQSLAAAEAWSMDVPTLAYRSPGYESVATVPYLTAATGAYWTSTEELLGLLKEISFAKHQPRSWVLGNMTDAVCAANLMHLVNQLQAAP